MQAQAQASELTTGLLSFAKQRESIDRPIRIGDFTKEIEPIIERIAGARISTTWKVECPEAIVVIEHLQFQQVFFNLVMNARHAIPDNGQIRIDIRETPARDAVGRAMSSKRFVCIKVTDNGGGMDETVMRRAFEPFFTTKPRGVGTGLGLSTTHGTVVKAGGAIEIQSRVGMGTTVRIHLPIAAGEIPFDHDHTPSIHEEKPVSDRSSSRIAVIEDRDILARSICALLRTAGHLPATFHSAEELLRTNYQHDFDLVISDIELPGMNGMELVDRLRETWPNARIILMSGHRRHDREIEHYASTTIAFLPKPFRLAELLETIKKVMSRHATIGVAAMYLSRWSLRVNRHSLFALGRLARLNAAFAKPSWAGGSSAARGGRRATMLITLSSFHSTLPQGRISRLREQRMQNPPGRRVERSEGRSSRGDGHLPSPRGRVSKLERSAFLVTRAQRGEVSRGPQGRVSRLRRAAHAKPSWQEGRAQRGEVGARRWYSPSPRFTRLSLKGEFPGCERSVCKTLLAGGSSAARGGRRAPMQITLSSFHSTLPQGRVSKAAECSACKNLPASRVQ